MGTRQNNLFVDIRDQRVQPQNPKSDILVVHLHVHLHCVNPVDGLYNNQGQVV